MDILASVAPRAMSPRQRRRFAANARAAIDAPDNLRKVACCPKCRGWFPSTEIRNAHRAEEHGQPLAGSVRVQLVFRDISAERFPGLLVEYRGAHEREIRALATKRGWPDIRIEWTAWREGEDECGRVMISNYIAHKGSTNVEA